MHVLSAQELLRAWEIGLEQHPLDRALTILEIACPESSRDALAALSIGQRDTRLFAIREKTFGVRLAGLATCPACQGQLEFVLNGADLRAAADKDSTEQVQQTTIEGYSLHFRLPNSLDLAAIVNCGDVVTARGLLVQRCVLRAYQDDVATRVEELPDWAITAVATRMTELDPQAEIQVDLNCPVCGNHWSVMLDIVAFFWTEICAHAKRLLREVHILAWAYGWREADILSMSTARRQFYLEMVT